MFKKFCPLSLLAVAFAILLIYAFFHGAQPSAPDANRVTSSDGSAPGNSLSRNTISKPMPGATPGDGCS
jgi:hypothetical protein